MSDSEPTAPLAPSAQQDVTPTARREEAAPPSPEVPAPGRTLAGRYTVLELLGKGGMGVVLAAYDSRLDRRVALKLLHSPEAQPHGQVRMVREAQAMARLNHPHVVAVYDAGTLEDGVTFIAMEYVEGRTLRRWCEEEPRPWHEVRRAYVAAGRGLAAAHESGLVHRDFKPENVLVGHEGRVRVTDFGVVRAESLELPAPVPSELRPDLAESTWDVSLTLPGMVVGTPRYMAPELLRGQPADARSDLFAFCVALYQALYGQPPFVGASRPERLQAQLKGQVQPPPAESAVPAWVTRAVLQGLRADPAERPASMPALLAALEDAPELRQRARRRALALFATVGALAVLSLTLGGLYLREQRGACAHQERGLDGVWDGPLREGVRRALLATGVPYAQDTATRVSAALDGYAGSWVRLRTEACHALREQAGQPQGLAALQVHCLERRRGQLQALSALLAREPDPGLVPRAMQAVQSLPPLEDCTDARALTAAVLPPENPQVRARVEALQPQVDRLEALYEAGKYKEGLALGGELSARVEPLDYVPMQAQFSFLLGSHQRGAGEQKDAEASLRRAIVLAARAKDDALVARAMAMLAGSMALGPRHPQEVMALEVPLLAALERTGDDSARANAHNALGIMLWSVGRYEEARERFETSLALWTKAVGPEHPMVASVLNNLGFVLQSHRKPEESLVHVERALALQRKALGVEHPEVGNTLQSLGVVLRQVGRYEEGHARLEEALALQRKVLGAEHPDVAHTLRESGALLAELGRYEEARARLEHALALKQKALGPEHSEVASLLPSLATILLRQGHFTQAQALLERALALQQTSLGAEHPGLVEPLHRMGELWLAQGRPARALPWLQRALAIEPEGNAELQFALAQALWESRTDREHALSLASRSRAHYLRLGHPRLAEVSRWLDTHGRP